MGRAEKCPEQYRIGDKGQEVSILLVSILEVSILQEVSNGVVRSRGMGYDREVLREGM